MSKHYYTAIVERAQDGYGVYFPDLPGCVSAGDTFEEAVANAEAALALHFEGMAEDGETLPPANMPDLIERDPDVDEVARVMIGAEWEAPKQRFNIMMDAALVAAIDAITDNRSRFLGEAARGHLLTLVSTTEVKNGPKNVGKVARSATTGAFITNKGTTKGKSVKYKRVV